MKRAYEIVEIIDERAPLLAALQRFIERRGTCLSPDDVISDQDLPHGFDRYQIGQPYGRYHEPIVRREVRRDSVPIWFDPRVSPGQFGLIGTDGLRCYIEVEINHEQRSAPSTFDEDIMTLVERTPEQTALF
jgi:hypothetical protein